MSSDEEQAVCASAPSERLGAVIIALQFAIAGMATYALIAHHGPALIAILVLLLALMQAMAQATIRRLCRANRYLLGALAMARTALERSSRG
jgi:hypothetical protein